jgi:hypothetical protein
MKCVLKLDANQININYRFQKTIHPFWKRYLIIINSAILVPRLERSKWEMAKKTRVYYEKSKLKKQKIHKAESQKAESQKAESLKRSNHKRPNLKWSKKSGLNFTE